MIEKYLSFNDIEFEPAADGFIVKRLPEGLGYKIEVRNQFSLSHNFKNPNSEFDIKNLFEEHFEYSGDKFEALPVIFKENNSNNTCFLFGLKGCINDIQKDFIDFCKKHAQETDVKVEFNS